MQKAVGGIKEWGAGLSCLPRSGSLTHSIPLPSAPFHLKGSLAVVKDAPIEEDDRNMVGNPAGKKVPE